jgi:hypothetical protein
MYVNIILIPFELMSVIVHPFAPGMGSLQGQRSRIIRASRQWVKKLAHKADAEAISGPAQSAANRSAGSSPQQDKWNVPM